MKYLILCCMACCLQAATFDPATHPFFPAFVPGDTENTLAQLAADFQLEDKDSDTSKAKIADFCDEIRRMGEKGMTQRVKSHTIFTDITTLTFPHHQLKRFQSNALLRQKVPGNIAVYTVFELLRGETVDKEKPVVLVFTQVGDTYRLYYMDE